MMKLLVLLLTKFSLLASFYCPEHHRHLGSRHVLKLWEDHENGLGSWKLDDQQGIRLDVETDMEGTPQAKNEKINQMPTPLYWKIQENERFVITIE